MDRELTFRTWDTERNEWYGTSDPSTLALYDFAMFGECMYYCLPPLEELGNVITTQYTGLRDKNGKKIFEGDIVKNQCFEYLLFVGYAEGGFFLQKNDKSDNPQRQYLSKIWMVSDLPGNWGEVVGNIFENPELLNN